MAAAKVPAPGALWDSPLVRGVAWPTVTPAEPRPRAEPHPPAALSAYRGAPGYDEWLTRGRSVDSSNSCCRLAQANGRTGRTSPNGQDHRPSANGSPATAATGKHSVSVAMPTTAPNLPRLGEAWL